MANPAISDQTGTIQQFYEALLRSESYSSKDLTRFQDNVLNELLPFVAKNVPFYKDRLAAVFRRDGTFDAENWARLPILTAAELRENHAAFRPTELPVSHGNAARYISSGSTGRPVAFYRSALSEAGQNAAQYRHYRAFNLDARKTLAMIRSFDPTLARSRPVPADRTRVPWTADWFAGGKAGYVKPLSVFTPAGKQVEWLQEMGEVYLNTVPSNALAIARYVARNPQSKPTLLAILTAGEPLTGEVRHQCLEYLGCKCINLYSSAECGLIACDCPVGNVMHVQSELCRAEILNSNGKATRPGEWGRLIVTPLYNFAMPLIRYDTGDLVRAAPSCSCGRNHLALEPDMGRPSNMFFRAPGEWFRPELDTAEMENLVGQGRWQIIQTGRRAFDFHYVPQNTNTAIDERRIRATLHKALGRGTAVKIKPIAALGPASSGKYQTILNRFHTKQPAPVSPAQGGAGFSQ